MLEAGLVTTVESVADVVGLLVVDDEAAVDAVEVEDATLVELAGFVEEETVEELELVLKTVVFALSVLVEEDIPALLLLPALPAQTNCI